MRLYLASRWGRKREMAEITSELASMGVQTTSHWVEEPKMDQKEDGSYSSGSWSPSPGVARLVATKDLVAICNSDALILFNDTSRAGYTGGRNVEFGIAVASDMPTIVVGPRTNPFHYVASAWFEDKDAFLLSIRDSATLMELIDHGNG